MEIAATALEHHSQLRYSITMDGTAKVASSKANGSKTMATTTQTTKTVGERAMDSLKSRIGYLLAAAQDAANQADAAEADATAKLHEACEADSDPIEGNREAVMAARAALVERQDALLALVAATDSVIWGMREGLHIAASADFSGKVKAPAAMRMALARYATNGLSNAMNTLS
jgi:hypothetical protein